MVALTVTPAVYNTTLSGDTSGTGLRVEVGSTTLGETSSYSTFQSKQGMYFNATMTRANLIFVTQRAAKLSVVAALSQVAGALSGMQKLSLICAGPQSLLRFTFLSRPHSAM